MASVRNRPNSQLVLPRDENAEAVGKLGSKGAGGGLGGKGLQQQQLQAKPIDRPRKLLGDITNVRNVQPHSASKAESLKPGSSNTSTGGSESVWKDGAKPPSSAKPTRLPLRNITNSGSQVKGALPLDGGRARKQDGSVSGAVKAGLQAEQSIVAEHSSGKVQRWAEEGIEKVHFTADDADALRQRTRNEEIEKRVATVVAYRTDFPRLWNPRVGGESKELKPLDVYELDRIPDRLAHSIGGSGDDEPVELTAPHGEQFLSSDDGLDDILASHLNWDAINICVRSLEEPGLV